MSGGFFCLFFNVLVFGAFWECTTHKTSYLPSVFSRDGDILDRAEFSLQQIHRLMLEACVKSRNFPRCFICSSVKSLSNEMSNSRCSVGAQMTSLQLSSLRHIIVSWTWNN
ncbi:hypothetical protein XENOCAPTIV_006970 [Xenoophorus captivus]|uniref:Secreted protein n=1 Tax=Xenoophorus captivus TaxID=1517983 RepID=A0ABV0SDS2_9TELE